MPDNKRQHYVPQFVLRGFSSDENKRQINIVNIERKKIIRRASLREQCYRDYFYGKSTEIEKSLATLEGVFATVFKAIIRTNAFDPRHEFYMAIMFALQKARTLRAEEDLNNFSDKLAKMMMYNRIDENELRKVKVSLNGAINLQVAHSLFLSPMLLDLKQFLIQNETAIPFVISDNPVITTNWFGRTRFRGRSLEGMARSGLQMLMPISPRHVILFHDSNVYTTHTVGNMIKLVKSQTVSELNDLQWLNAHKNIYFSDGLKDEIINGFFKLDRGREKATLFERLESTDDGKSYSRTEKDEFSAPSEGVVSEIIRFGSRIISKDLRLEGVRFRAKPLMQDDGSMGSPKRDPVWCQIIEDFADAMQSKQCTFNDLWGFVASHHRHSEIGPWLARVSRRAKTR